MKLDNVLMCMFLFSFLALTVHKTQSLFAPYWWTNKIRSLLQLVTCEIEKQKVVHGRATSNINLGIFVCSFDVCWASYFLIPINYPLSTMYSKSLCYCSVTWFQPLYVLFKVYLDHRQVNHFRLLLPVLILINLCVIGS